MQRYFALLTLLVLPFVVGATPPSLGIINTKPSAFVHDYSGTLSNEQSLFLETKLQAFEQSTTNEVAVVVVSSLYDITGVTGDTIENLAQQLFTKWEIGKAEKNNGVLLLISIGDRQARIHTGYGVEGDLTDIETSYIQQEVMIPAFRDGNYYLGIDSATNKIIESLGGTTIVPEGYSKSGILDGLNFEMIFFFAFIIFEILVSMLAKSKSWWGGGVVGGVAGGGIIWYFGIVTILAGVFAFIIPVILGLIIDYFVSKSYSNARSLGTYPWWMGRGGGGMGGGGFGGFGGGMSGGGGSSSRW